eukprot:jgi/Orpsp1_1/1175324/evm.model.c7180000053412.1
MYHIISYGCIINIIVDELNKYYNGKEVKELEIQFSDYAINLNEKKNNGKLKEQIEIYKEIFSNEYIILNIPTINKIKNEDNNRDDNNENMECNSYERIIDKSTNEKINAFVKHHNISKTAFFISIYGYILSKYSGQDTIYTSVMSENHNNHYAENMAGMFVSTLPILLKYNNENNKFIFIIKESMEMLVNINNQDISFAELTEILKLKKINNSFIFQSKAITKNKNNNSKFDITFNVIENENNYLISIEYDTLLYDSIMIKNILNSCIEIIQNIQSFEINSVKALEYIPMDEKERIIKEFNSSVNKDGSELDEMSNSLAHYLYLQGIERNDIVPIICDRSPMYVVGILGISKKGGAYLPVDRNLPIERLQFILKDSNPKIVLYKNCKDVIEKIKNNECNNKFM